MRAGLLPAPPGLLPRPTQQQYPPSSQYAPPRNHHDHGPQRPVGASHTSYNRPSQDDTTQRRQRVPSNGGGNALTSRKKSVPESYSPHPALSQLPTKPLYVPSGEESKLQNEWVLFYDFSARTSTTRERSFGESLKVVAHINSVESFWAMFNAILLPSEMELGANYHFFKKGIKPLWEDPSNINGGKWVLQLKPAIVKMDSCWMHCLLGLIGEIVDMGDDVTGAVASRRSKIERISIWTRSKDEQVNLGIGKRLVEAMKLIEHQVEFEMSFQHHEDSMERSASFTNTPRITTQRLKDAVRDPRLPSLKF